MYEEQLKQLVGPAVYSRGATYYEEQKVRHFRTRMNEAGCVELSATVAGTHFYTTRVEMSVSDVGFRILDASCTCLFDGADYCKHQVAVIYRFLCQDLQPFTTGLQTASAKDFEFLRDMAYHPKNARIKLQYFIKGLLKSGTANFRITLGAAGEGAELMNELNRLVTDRYYLNYRVQEREAVFARLDGFDRMILERFTKTQTRSDTKRGAIYIAKTKDNLNFLFTLLQNREVFLEENGQPLKLGGPVTPEVRLAGDEKKVRFHYNFKSLESQGLYSPELMFLLDDDTIHPVELPDMDGVPPEIDIPSGREGEFLFEILPKLRERFPLTLDPSMQGHRLHIVEPQIRMSFDYQNGRITCLPVIEVQDRRYEGLDALKYIAYPPAYTRLGDERKEWYTVNHDSLRAVSGFLARNKFLISHAEIILNNPGDMLEFILTGYRHLPEDWENAASESFLDFKVIPVSLEPQVELNLDGSIDWFDCNITYNIGGRSYSHKEILKMLRRNAHGERYLQIGSAFYIFEETAKMDVVSEVLAGMNRKAADNKVELHNLFFYRQLFLESGIKIHGNDVYNELEENITGKNLITDYELPAGLHGELRGYQKEGFFWLRFLEKYKLNGVLADDMGLGKTIEVLTLLKSLKSEFPSLVVCPRSLLYNWAAEIEKFYPETQYLVYHGTPDERSRLRDGFNDQDIVITTYDMVNRDEHQLKLLRFHYCILDEAQHIKNYATQRSKSIKTLNAEHRLVMTGTPLENNLVELWSLFDFLMPGYLGSRQKFIAKYATPVQKEKDTEALRLLKQKISPFVLRRRKDDVLRELPEKNVIVQKAPLTKLQEDTYRAVLGQVRQNVLETVADKGYEKSQITVLAALTKLRQICNHPKLALPDLDSSLESGKVEALMELVLEAIDSGHKLVIFSQFVKMLQIIEERFRKVGIDYEYLDGSVIDRQERIDRFNNTSAIPAFLISLKAGGVGINLTSADTVIHVDPWWNPMVENQATDRVHRIGQQRQVTVYKLITAGTVEEKLVELQARKKSVFDVVVENNENPISSLKWEDIKVLFEL